jgi:hypothetical protein
MLRAVPKGWFSATHILSENDVEIGMIQFSGWREAGELSIKGSTYRVYRESLMGPFLLEGGGSSLLARAEKPSALYRTLVVQHADRKYTIEAKSGWSLHFIVLENEKEIGTIYPEGSLRRKALADLPEEIPLTVRTFMLWLVMILWRRSDSASSG